MNYGVTVPEHQHLWRVI